MFSFCRKGRTGRICIWGEEYFIIPKQFLDLLKLHCQKNFSVEGSSVSGRVGAFLNDARMKGKSAAKVRSYA